MAPTPPEQTKKNLAQKVVAIMAAVGSVNKDKTNDFHKYKYVSDEAIVTALRAAMINEGVILSPSQKSCTEIIQKNAKGEEQTLTKLEVEFEIQDADSGEKRTTVFFGYGADKGDKGVYKAMTGAEKYFLLKTFLVPTTDDPEQEGARRAWSNNAKPSAPPARPPIKTPPPQSVPNQALATTAPPITENSAVGSVGTPARKIINATLRDVTMVPAKNGAVPYYNLNGIEGETWKTFSATMARNAKAFAAEKVHLAIALDLFPDGPIVAGIKPA